MQGTPKKKKPAKAPAGKAPADDARVSQALELYKQLQEAKSKMSSAELKAFRKKKEDWNAEISANKAAQHPFRQVDVSIRVAVYVAALCRITIPSLNESVLPSLGLPDVAPESQKRWLGTPPAVPSGRYDPQIPELCPILEQIDFAFGGGGRAEAS